MKIVAYTEYEGVHNYNESGVRQVINVPITISLAPQQQGGGSLEGRTLA